MQRLKQLGQGMTEYIIIVALIAIAAIAVYSFFGDTIRGQMTTMTEELSGAGTSTGRTATGDAGSAVVDEADHRGLGDYEGAAAAP